MNDSDSLNSAFAQRLAASRHGSPEEFGTLLESFRGYLLVVANGAVGGQLRAKVAASDLVQETLLKAHRNFSQFRGNSSEELLAWLREILANNVLHASRSYYGTERRQLSREQPLDHDDSRLGRIDPSDPMPTPREAVATQEDAMALRAAMNRLPTDYRQAVLLRNWERLPFEEVGRRLNRSPEAARKLWARAILLLKRELQISGKLPDDSDIQLATT